MTLSTDSQCNLIFDFDGTIADSFEVFIESLHSILGRRENLSPEEIEHLRSLSLTDIIKKLGIKRWQMPFMAIRGRNKVAQSSDKITVFSNIIPILHSLSEHNQLFILSTNRGDVITDILQRYNLLDIFVGIHAGSSITGKAKRLKKLMKIEHLQSESCIYIGDEVRDIEAAKKQGIQSVAVTWGFSTPESLAKAKADLLVSEPHDLLDLSWLLRTNCHHSKDRGENGDFI